MYGTSHLLSASVVTVLVLALTPAGISGQDARGTQSTQASQSSLVPPSQILQPALDNLQQTLGTIRLDKWKAPGPARQQTDGNITSILGDLRTTLPPLLQAADAHPASVSRVLPVFRNVDALYDVMLRVTQIGEAFAPDAQARALDDSLARLRDARLALGDRLQASAGAQEQQISDLQSALQSRPASAPATVPGTADPKHTPRPKRKSTHPANAAAKT